MVKMSRRNNRLGNDNNSLIKVVLSLSSSLLLLLLLLLQINSIENNVEANSITTKTKTKTNIKTTSSKSSKRSTIIVKEREYKCVNDQCVQIQIDEDRDNSMNDTTKLSLDVCKITCEKSLWPKPSISYEINDQVSSVGMISMVLKDHIITHDNNNNDNKDVDNKEMNNILFQMIEIFFEERLLHVTQQQSNKHGNDNEDPLLYNCIHKNLEKDENDRKKKKNKKKNKNKKVYSNYKRGKKNDMMKENSISNHDHIKIHFNVKDSTVINLDLDTDESYELIRYSSAKDSTNVKKNMNNNIVYINAQTIYGIRHALETLAQLFVYDNMDVSDHHVKRNENENENEKKRFVLPISFEIIDKPSFAYRGLMIDVSRNFIPIEYLKENIRALSMSKMNVLHLHLSDTASFPLELLSYPEITSTGAYSQSQIYWINEMKELFEYAFLRGVRIIPEIDQPGHAREGWKFGDKKRNNENDLDSDLGRLVVCDNIFGVEWTDTGVEPPTGQFNPVNENVLKILGDIYFEMIQEYNKGDDSDINLSLIDELNSLNLMNIFHTGGDEIFVGNDVKGCWNSTLKAPEIIDYITKNDLDRNNIDTFYGLWFNFTQKSFQNLATAYEKYDNENNNNNNKIQGNFRIMNWAGYDDGVNLVKYLADKNELDSLYSKDKMIFQVWDVVTNSLAPTLVNEEYDIIIANYDNLYFDCGEPGWVSPNFYCPYNSWQKVYESIYLTLDSYQQQGALPEMLEKHTLGASVEMWTEKFSSTSIVPRVWPRASALAEALWNLNNGTAYDATSRFVWNRERLVKYGIQAQALVPKWCVQNIDGSCQLPPS